MGNLKIYFIIFLFIYGFYDLKAQRKRIREYGIKIGVLSPGKYNAITDVKGVKVGHFTLIQGDNVRTGVTAILPHSANIFQEKVPAAVYVGNGYGKFIGYTQIEELGTIETPIILTNTLSVPVAADALIDYILSLKGNENVYSVNPVVGETNDGWLNDIQARYIKKEHVLKAIENASSGMVKEGAVGAGTGTICFGFKGGIGTASRKLPENFGGYTVGVLVQTNFGGVLQIDGIAIAKHLGKFYLSKKLNTNPDGSCMIVIATDAPLSPRNLKRLAKRAMLGLAKTGGISSNSSGDYVIAFSTNEKLRIAHKTENPTMNIEILRNDKISPLFMAVIEATEEAILNSLFVADSMRGRNKHFIKSLPVKKVIEIMKKYRKDENINTQ